MKKGFLYALVVMVLAFGLGCFFAWIQQLLWNYFMPDLFGIRTISFWESWGIMFLTSLLFRSTKINFKD